MLDRFPRLLQRVKSGERWTFAGSVLLCAVLVSPGAIVAQFSPPPSQNAGGTLATNPANQSPDNSLPPPPASRSSDFALLRRTAFQYAPPPGRGTPQPAEAQGAAAPTEPDQGASPQTEPEQGATPQTEPGPAASAEAGSTETNPPPQDNFPLQANYKYNGGGGYTSITSNQTDFTLNIQNQLTLDGTFADRNVPTTEQGFNIPFYRTYLFGNITKNIDYQASVQGFLGSFNVLDLWVNGRYDDRFNVRAGRQLTPFLYEYYGFSPAWEPVITNSLLFQIAGKRQEGVMAWGKLFGNRMQYQGGVFNGVSGSFFGIGRNVSFLGAATVTPFKGCGNCFDSLGFGAGVETGWQDYLLSSGSTLNFVNGAGEPTLNDSFVNSTGVPFFTYNPNVAAAGNQTKFAPHFFWFGQFSLLAEYVWMDRTLTNGTTTGVSVTQGWYVMGSYLLTGERHSGDGLAGYTTVTPRSPFIPTKGQWGPGAWEAAIQYSQLNLDSRDFARGFADGTMWANRCDQLMVGMNWWPNKYTRCSFDWMYNTFNRPITINGGTANDLNTYWGRVAVFF
jgi:phosphate-selective porin OprO/OprP